MIEQPAPAVEERQGRAGERLPARPCPNCDTWVDDEFCPHCGQRNATRLVSVRRFVRDALEDQFSLNGTLPRTLGALLFRPGRLTADYVDGRIARYIPPLKLYLLASVVFFVAVWSIADADVIWRRVEPQVRAAEAENARVGGEKVRNVDFQIDTVGAPAITRPLVRRILRRQDELNEMTPRESLRAMFEAAQRTAPKVAFLLVPVFAAFLKLLYLRRKRLYAEHFVFALHFHAFVFLTAAVMILAWNPLVSAVHSLAVVVYLLLAMKRVYAQGWPKTVLKYGALLAAYSVVLVGMIVLMTVLSVVAA